VTKAERPATGEGVPPPRRSLDAIIFDLVLISFSATLVFASIGLRAGVGTVPLLVGIPTLLGSLGILVVDLFPGLRPPPSADAGGGLHLHALMAAAKESEDDLELGSGPSERRRQVAFTAWAIGFVVLASISTFYVAVPVALVVVFAAIRLDWRANVLITAATVALFYGLFDAFLGVRF
jgi:hypothetical protein